MKNQISLILLIILLCFSLYSCKSAYISHRAEPELYSFKIIQDKEMLIVKADSAYILDCFRDNPDILEKILLGENFIDSMSSRAVVQRGSELGKKLHLYANYKDAKVVYLMCVKPDGNVALTRLLESNIDDEGRSIKAIQHLAFDYKFEENLNDKCLACGKLKFHFKYDEKSTFLRN